DELAGRGGDDLLADEGTAVALDEVAAEIDLVGPVHGDVEGFDVLQGGEGDAESAGKVGRRLGRGHAANAQPGPDAVGKSVQEGGGGPAGTEADDGPVRDELQRLLSDEERFVRFAAHVRSP